MALTKQQQAAPEKNDVLALTALATVDCADKANRFVKYAAAPAGSIGHLGFAFCGLGDEPDWVSPEEMDAGDAARVEASGIVLIELGATVAQFAEVAPDSLGRGVTAANGEGYIRVHKAGVVGDVVPGLWLFRRRRGGAVEANDNGDTFNAYATLHKITISAGADTATLPSGLYAGQPKRLRVVADGGGSYALTGVYTKGGTNTVLATFAAVTDELDLEWDGTRWYALNVSGVVLS